jgi:hypothetical protein
MRDAAQGYAEIICLGWVCGRAANPTQTISSVVVRRQAHRVLFNVQSFALETRTYISFWGYAAKN